MEVVHRCGKCNRKCEEILEDITKSPTRILFVEGNKNNRKAASDELSMKLLVWGHAAPPMKITCSPSPVDAVVYEKAKVLINGTVFIEEDQISRSSQDDFDLPELTDEENER